MTPSSARARRRLADSARAFSATAHNPNLLRAQLPFGAAWTAEWAFTVALGVPCATVRARTPLRLYTLDRQDFRSAVTDYEASGQEADSLVFERLGTFDPRVTSRE